MITEATEVRLPELALPDLDKIRPLILKGLDVAADGAALTDTTVDDQVVAAARKLVDSPLFGLAYGVISRRLARLPEAATESDAAALAAAAPEGVPILAILALIQEAIVLVKPLIDRWQQRRNVEPQPAV